MYRDLIYWFHVSKIVNRGHIFGGYITIDRWLKLITKKIKTNI